MKTSKKILALTLVVLMVICTVPFSVGATFSGECYYDVLSDGTAEITYYDGWDSTLTIPATIDGYKVTSIGDFALSECPDIESITIPAGVTHIGTGVFYWCESLTSIKVDSSNKNYCDVNGILFNKNKTELICCPCAKTGSYTIPSTVTSIDDYAFADCYMLTGIKVPSSVTSIGNCAFLCCISTTKITVDSSNKNYCDVDGVLFNKNKTQLISYPGGKDDSDSYTIPDSVTSICNNAFSNCYNLTEVVIPYGITNIGNGMFEYCTNLFDIILPESVTSIGDYAFYGCENMSGIIIPKSVKSIGEEAFGECYYLTIYGYENSYAQSYADDNFISFESLDGSAWEYDVLSDGTAEITGYNGPGRNIVIPDTVDGYTVTSIGDYAFYNYTSLKSVIIPEGVTNIGNYAFNWCYQLENLSIQSGVTSIGDCAFSDCSSLESITIPDGVTNIGYGVFDSCTNLTNVTIPNSVTSIDDWAFSGCLSLMGIIIPDSVTYISDCAFYNCYEDLVIYGYEGSYAQSYAEDNYISFESLGDSVWEYEVLSDGTAEITGYNGSETKLVIPDTIGKYRVTSIGYWAFEDCSSLESITIPDSVTSIDSSAFSDCRNLKSITVDKNNTAYCDIDGVLFSMVNREIICYPANKTGTSYAIPRGIESISHHAFFDCRNLESVTIPSSVTSIDSNAFSDCRNLKSITLPDSVTSIGNDAFYDCSSLTDITIPSSVTSIGSGAFSHCRNLKTVTIPSSITFIGLYVFSDCINLESITIPNGVTGLDWGAFSGCSSLKSITIPESVEYIGEDTFDGCNNLTLYGYKGSYAQSYAAENGIPFKVIEKPVLTSDVFVFKIDDENIYYANDDVKFTAGAAPIMQDGKAIVPLRSIASAAGISDLKYDAATKKITFTGFDGYKVEMQSGSTKCTLTKGSEKIELTIVAPYTKDGSAMLPLRDTANLVGGYVKYSDHYIVVSKGAIADAAIPGYIAAYDAK